MSNEPRKLKRVVIKEELVALTGDHEKAIILNQFIYWSERVKDFDKFLLEEMTRARTEGREINVELRNGWIYKKMDELTEEIMLTTSPKTVRRKVMELVEMGYLDERKNPENKMDRVLQYRVNILKIMRDLKKLGYPLDGYPLLLDQDDESAEPSKRQNDFSKGQIDLSNRHGDFSKGQNVPPNGQDVSRKDTVSEQYHRLQTETTYRDYNNNISKPESAIKQDNDRESHSANVVVVDPILALAKQHNLRLTEKVFTKWRKKTDDTMILLYLTHAVLNEKVKNKIAWLTLHTAKAVGFLGGSRKSISGIRSSPSSGVCHHPVLRQSL